MQLPNDIPIWNSVESVIVGKFLVIFEVRYLSMEYLWYMVSME